MTIEILTIFPQFYKSFFKTGLVAKAVKNGIIDYHIVGLRKYGNGRLKKVDDTPYGGAPGMLIKKDVLEKGLQDCQGLHVVCMSPRGVILDHYKAKTLAQRASLTLVCGHYEGMDQRFIDEYVDEEISIGDYILMGGETASLVLMESVFRYLGGFLGNPISHHTESFENNLLENDQYTKPYSKEIPSVLLSGNHALINAWYRSNSLVNTYRKRPDLFKKKRIPIEDEIKIKKYFYTIFSSQREEPSMERRNHGTHY